jgi:hypothetical protein
MPPSPFTASASNSTFSLALDPIAEQPTSIFPDPDTSTETSAKTSSTGPLNLKHVRHSQVGLGHPPSISRPHPRAPFSVPFSQSNVELILYSYIQLVGTVTLVPPHGAFPSQTQIDTLNSLRLKIAKRPTFGGGSMDITSSLHHGRSSHSEARRASHRRSTSLSSGLLSLLSPSSLVASSSTPPTSLRSSSSSMFSGLFASTPSSDGHDKVGLGIVSQGEVDPETPLPTFEVQPAMLAVDLPLRPGESRCCTFSFIKQTSFG